MQHDHRAPRAATHPYLDGPWPRAFAHRGWHLGDLAGRENSLQAMRRAVDEGFPYLEIDVHATADGVVVVHHDATLDRTTDATGLVAARPWADVRRALVGGVEPVCALEHAIEELPGARLNVDVKADSAVGPVLDVLRRADAWDRVCLASFSDARLARLRAAAGSAPLLTSMGPRAVAALRAWSWSRLPARAGTGPTRLAQVPRRRGRLTVVDAAMVRAARLRGVEVHVWTVDTAAEMTELLDLGVDGIVTDRPDVLRDVLRNRDSWPAS